MPASWRGQDMRGSPGPALEEGGLRGRRRLGACPTICVAGVCLAIAAMAQSPGACSCGVNPPGPPAQRTLEPYANAPDDLRPYSHFTKPYYEFYTKTVEYNGPARDVPTPEVKDITEVR